MIKPLLFIFLLAFSATLQAETVPGRWYSYSIVETGNRIFKENCAQCHGASAQGLTDDFRKPLADGSYPPPPLNGTAHSWHHPLSGLFKTISNGGIAIGGKMPPFKNSLSEEDRLSVIASFQNWWPDNIYQAWIDRGGLSK